MIIKEEVMNWKGSWGTWEALKRKKVGWKWYKYNAHASIFQKKRKEGRERGKEEGGKEGSNTLYNKIQNAQTNWTLQQIQQQVPFLTGEASALVVGTDLSLSGTEWSLAPADCCILVWPEQGKAAVRCQETSRGRQRGGHREPRKHRCETHWSLAGKTILNVYSEVEGSKLQTRKIFKDHPTHLSLYSIVKQSLLRGQRPERLGAGTISPSNKAPWCWG